MECREKTEVFILSDNFCNIGDSIIELIEGIFSIIRVNCSNNVNSSVNERY